MVWEPEEVVALLNEDEACRFAEWVNQQTGFQTAVVAWKDRDAVFMYPVWKIVVVLDTGARTILLSRRDVARFVNGRGR